MLKIEVKLPELPGGRDVLPPLLEEAARVNAAELVMERVREHFLRRGGRQYWRAAADAVAVGPGGKDEMLVRVPHRGVALHYYGGTVRPREKKLLALPAAPGVREYARSVPGLVMVPMRGYPHLRGLLVETEEATAARRYKDKAAGRRIRRAVIGADGKLAVKYALVDETHHPADPTVLPTDEELAEAARQGAEEAIALTIDH